MTSPFGSSATPRLATPQRSANQTFESSIAVKRRFSQSIEDNKVEREREPSSSSARSGQRLPDSIESCCNGHAIEEDQVATKKRKRQTAATGKGTGATTKPKSKKKTSRGK
jgi:hypothetical protein